MGKYLRSEANESVDASWMIPSMSTCSWSNGAVCIIPSRSDGFCTSSPAFDVRNASEGIFIELLFSCPTSRCQRDLHEQLLSGRACDDGHWKWKIKCRGYIRVHLPGQYLTCGTDSEHVEDKCTIQQHQSLVVACPSRSAEPCLYASS